MHLLTRFRPCRYFQYIQPFSARLLLLPAILSMPETRNLPSTFALAATLFLGHPVVSAQDHAKGQPIDVPDAQVSLIQNTVIASPISGVVSEVPVKEGMEIRDGELLVQLDADHVKTEMEAAAAAFEAARMEGENDIDARYAQRSLEYHLRELEQSRQANTQFDGAVSDSEVEKQRLLADQARLQIEQAKHQQTVSLAKAKEKEAAAKMAEQRIEQHSILSSGDGQIVEISVQPGEWVDAGTPVARVISLDPIRIDCFIDGRSYGSELVGHDVTFLCDKLPGSKPGDPPARFPGKIVFVSPELHPVTGQVRLWATVANPKHRLRSGMQGRVQIAP